MRIVTDFDGTVPHILPILYLQLPEDILVITGQARERNDNTRIKLDRMGLKDVILSCHPAYDARDFGPYILNSIIKWKGEEVRDFNADIFFDDDLRVIIGVKAMNPTVVCCLVV